MEWKEMVWRRNKSMEGFGMHGRGRVKRKDMYKGLKNV